MKKIILIDPGHGADTPGKRSPDGSLREYEFNRSVARLLKSRLEACGFTTRLTVEDDTDMPLRKRTNLAEFLKSSGFNVFMVSIHANAAGSGSWNDAHGIETFTNNAAKQFADKIQRSLIQETRLRDRGVKQDNLHITRETAYVGIPAVLVELGFMTNKAECEQLKSQSYRQKCAEAIAKGICESYGIKYSHPVDHPAQQNPCYIELNGELLSVLGKLHNGTALLPIRAVVEAAGGKVDWCEEFKQVRVNGHDMDETFENGLSYAPARQIAASLNMKVEWVDATDTVRLTKA